MWHVSWIHCNFHWCWEFWIYRFDKINSELKNLLKNILTVLPECWNFSWILALGASNKKVQEKFQYSGESNIQEKPFLIICWEGIYVSLYFNSRSFKQEVKERFQHFAVISTKKLNSFCGYLNFKSQCERQRHRISSTYFKLTNVMSVFEVSKINI